ncbi:MAG: exodeoxyribonuclease VII small subunit [Deltaproteobacteria bacterium]|nr:exodeoxyribonuclease VII small subunit [Deltaproteobacteria bacterium]
MQDRQDVGLPGFEEALADLEARVRRLESGDIGLEEALALFEEGVGLAQTCHEHLQEAERRVTALSRGAEGILEEPLPEPEDE